MKPIRAGGLLVALLLAGSFAPHAQAQTVGDPRWQSWLGCWTAVQNDTMMPATAVCVIPAAGTSAVDIVQIADLQVIARTHVDADGTPHPSVRDGCAGWDRAEWSPDGWRLFLHAEHECSGEVHRVTTAIMVMQGGGSWLTVLGANAAGRRSVQLRHYRMAPDDIAIPEEVVTALNDSLAAWRVARVADVSPVDPDEIIAASRQVDLLVLEAWLAETAGTVRYNGRQLVQLADSGVQASTIDLLVALANPGVFSVAARPPSRQWTGVTGSYGAAFLPFGYAFGAGPLVDAGLARRCQAFYDMWLMTPADYRYNSEYCGTYGYGRGYGWYDNQPAVQVVAGGAAPPSGRAVNGRGYTKGSDSGTRATPDVPSHSGGAEQSSAGSGQQAAASPGGYGSGSPTSTPTERTAIPRP